MFIATNRARNNRSHSPLGFKTSKALQDDGLPVVPFTPSMDIFFTIKKRKKMAEPSNPICNPQEIDNPCVTIIDE